MSDLIDFLEGYQELYSSFLHALDPKKTYRLWTCLGANGINDDLVQKKMRLHFDRAQRGESAESFVLPKVRAAFNR